MAMSSLLSASITILLGRRSLNTGTASIVLFIMRESQTDAFLFFRSLQVRIGGMDGVFCKSALLCSQTPEVMANESDFPFN
jgi:hypothetical protein